MHWNPQGTLTRGRPRITWRRGIFKDLTEANLNWYETKRSGSRPTKVGGNCGRSILPMGQRLIHNLNNIAPFSLVVNEINEESKLRK